MAVYTEDGYDSEAQALSALIDSTSVPDPSRPVDSQRLQTILVNQVLLKSSLKSIQDQQGALVKIVVIIKIDNTRRPSRNPFRTHHRVVISIDKLHTPSESRTNWLPLP